MEMRRDTMWNVLGRRAEGTLFCGVLPQVQVSCSSMDEKVKRVTSVVALVTRRA